MATTFEMHASDWDRRLGYMRGALDMVQYTNVTEKAGDNSEQPTLGRESSGVRRDACWLRIRTWRRSHWARNE